MFSTWNKTTELNELALVLYKRAPEQSKVDKTWLSESNEEMCLL